MQLGPLNPLEECISQFSDTKVASQRCHIELFGEKLTKCTALGENNLVTSIITAVHSKGYPCMVCYIKLWITGLCYA